MARQYVQTHKHFLKASIGASDTSITLTFLKKMGSTGDLSMTDFGDLGYATIDPTSTTKAENVSFTGVTDNGDGTFTLTGVTRGLKGVSDYSTGGNAVSHSSGATVVFSNSAPFYAQFGNIKNTNTWDKKQTFSVVPETTADATSANDMVRLSQLQAAVLGTLSSAPLVMPGNAGETVAADKLVFLNDADSEWYLADADVAAEVNNVMLGITRGAGTDGNEITNGITVLGKHTASSAIFTANQIYYASNTAGEFSSTPGTNEVTLGVAISTTVINFIPRFNQQLTEDQQDALVGTSGTPSASNKFVTNDDTTGTGAVVRKSLVSYGGDGSDGALDTSGGVVNIDCANASLVVKQYTSINVVTNNLTFTNPASTGTTVILRSQGDVTISATIDLSGMGAAGGAAGTGAGGDGAAGTQAAAIFDDQTDHAGQATSGTTTGGATGSAYLLKRAYASSQETYEVGRTLYISPGSGGGGGAASDGGATDGDGGAGGRGGGALIIECAGDLNFTGTIDVSGDNGSDAPDITGANPAGGGGGGGGAAGMAVVIYNSATSTAGTINSAGGAGGAGGDATNTSGSGSGTAGAGGGGAAAFPGVGGAGANGASGGANTNGTTGGAAAANSAGGGGGSGAIRPASTGTSTGGAGGAGGASNSGLVTVNVI